jgi:hypothetical protein
MSDDPPECTSLPIPVGKSSSGGGGGDGNTNNTTTKAITDDPNRNKESSSQAAAAEDGVPSSSAAAAAALASKDVHRASPTGNEQTESDTNQPSGSGDKNAQSTSYFTEAMSSLYATTVDAPCRRVHELEHTIQESFLNCQQFDFLHFLKTEEGHVDESVYARNAPIGPPHCEYCGAASTELCGPGCERPRLFFRNKRPPFGRKEEWDSSTGYRLRDAGGGGGDDQAVGALADQCDIVAEQGDDDDVLTSFNSLAADGNPDQEAQLKAEEDAWCDGGFRRTFAC